jgi:SH3-like domain-containing protein
MAHNQTRRFLSVSWLLALAILVVPAAAETGLPVPRFVSLRSTETNLRAGPGTGYPVDWVLLRRAWPVEVIAEYDTWRRIRDVEGTVGWVHQTMLSGERTVVVVGEVRTLHAAPAENAPPVLRAGPGVIAVLDACDAAWCRVEIAGTRGWIPRDQVYGVLPDETFE